MSNTRLPWGEHVLGMLHIINIKLTNISNEDVLALCGEFNLQLNEYVDKNGKQAYSIMGSIHQQEYPRYCMKKELFRKKFLKSQLAVDIALIQSNIRQYEEFTSGESVAYVSGIPNDLPF